MIGLGLSIPEVAVRGGAPGNSAQVQQFFNRLLTPPAAARQTLYANLINGLVTDGVWSLLDALYTFAAADSDTALTNLVQSTYKATLDTGTGAVDFTVDVGFTGHALHRCVVTNFNPSTASGAKYTQNNAMIAAWSLTNNTTDNWSLMADAALANVEISPHWAGNVSFYMVNSATEPSAASPADTTGFWLAQRTASNAFALYQNNSQNGSNGGASSALTNNNIIIVSAQAPATSGSKACAAAIGGSLTSGQRTALYTRLQTYLHAVGAV